VACVSDMGVGCDVAELSPFPIQNYFF
jgi:hypothetical protein